MADIGISVGLDTSQLQQGAKGAADSLGNIREEITKLNTSAEQRNAIYDYLAKAEESAKQYAGSLDKINELVKQIQQQNGTLPTPTVQQNNQNPQPNVSQIQQQNGTLPTPTVQQNNNPFSTLPDNTSRVADSLRNANVDRLKGQLHFVNEELDDIYDTMQGIDKHTNMQDYASLATVAARLEEVKRGLSSEINRLENGTTKQNNGNNNKGFYGFLQRSVGGVPAIINNVGNGNLASLAVQGLTSGAGLLKSGSAAAAEGGAALAGLSPALLATGGVALIGALVAAGGNAMANQWEKNSEEAVDMQALYGRNIEGKTKQQNSEELRELFNTASAKNERNFTGYTTQEFMQLASGFSRFGINNSYSAMNNASDVLSWQRWSGADRGVLQNFVGNAMRYGAATTANNALNPAYAALEQSGMHKGQLNEMLSSIQSVLEEGIANGFVKSTEEIANNLSMLSKLSGNNVLWQGQNGAQRLSQMNSALANSTSLESVSAVMNYQAANNARGKMLAELSDEKTTPQRRAYIKDQLKGIDTGTYIDTMLLMEKGLSPDILKAQFDAVGSMEGDNTAGAIERFRQMYNLNYTGAKQVYDMYEKSRNGEVDWNSFYKAVNGITQKTEYQSEETSYKTAVINIKDQIAKMGQDLFSIREKIVGVDSTAKMVETAKENAAAYAPSVPAFDRTFTETGSYKNYNPVNEKWEQLKKAGLVFEAFEVKDMSHPMSKWEWQNSDGKAIGGTRTRDNYEEGLKSGDAYYSKMITGEEAKGFFFNAESMEAIREQEAKFRLPESEGGMDLSEKEKAILNSMFEEMYKEYNKKYNPSADDAMIKKFLQIIAENTSAQKDQPIVINLTAPN